MIEKNISHYPDWLEIPLRRRDKILEKIGEGGTHGAAGLVSIKKRGSIDDW